MGKIKSAIITAILIAAIVVLGFFATVSFSVAGSSTDNYNSFISSIRLGSNLSGEAETVLYPEGVISATEYKLFTYGADEDKINEYKQKYTQYGSVYVETDKITELTEEGFKNSVKADAEVLSKRFGEKGYSSYSVSVQDDFTVKVSVPTNFSYAMYKGNASDAYSTETSAIEQTIKFMFYSGELSLRNSEVGKTNHDNILTPIADDITTYFKSVKKASAGGNYAVRLNLTKTGREQLKTISNNIVNNATDDKAIGFYIGDNQLLSLSVSDEIDGGSFYITIPNGNDTIAQDYAIVLDSATKGETLTLDYKTDEFSVTYGTAVLGEHAAVYLGAAMCAIILAAIVYSVVRYKKLGLVNAIIILMYSLVIIVALTVIGIQFTIAGAVTAVLGLALLCGSNFALFEEVRKETEKGKTMQSAIKSAYKNLLAGILEMHIILVAVSLIIALVCVGELASCGMIFFIASIASYVLYWFTRFMWYVISSPVKDKFKFGGFTREEQIDG